MELYWQEKTKVIGENQKPFKSNFLEEFFMAV